MPLNKPTIDIKPISQKGQCILTIRYATDHPNHPSVQQQMPTHVAEYLRAAAFAYEGDYYDIYNVVNNCWQCCVKSFSEDDAKRQAAEICPIAKEFMKASLRVDGN